MSVMQPKRGPTDVRERSCEQKGETVDDSRYRGKVIYYHTFSTSPSIRELKMGEDSDRATRMARRTEREQAEKRRTRHYREGKSSSTPGASSVNTNSASSRTDRMRTRAEEEREAKNRARDGGRQNGRSKKSRSPHRDRNRRSQDEEDAKRRAKSGKSSGVNPGAQSYGAAPAPNGNGALEIQAETVNESEEMSKMKQQMMDENERLRQEMAQENDSLRRQMECDNAALRNQMKGHGSDREQPSNNEEEKAPFPTKYKIAIAVVILVIGGGLGAFFGLSGSSSSEAAAAAATLTNAPVTVIPTEMPTPVASVTPTTATTEEPLYSKPTPGACVQVAAGEPVLGQNKMTTRIFDVTLDVSLVAETGVDTMLDALQTQTQEILVPELVGCNDQRRRREKNSVILRQSSTDRRRYAIANADATVVHDESQTCVSTGTGPCYRVVTSLNLFIKDETESDGVLNNLIVGVYDVESLAADLGIDALIDYIAFEDSLPAPITDSPTLAPATAPTLAPVSVPTLAPISTPSPTPGPTPNPTPRPTLRPTTSTPNCADNCQGDGACPEDAPEGVIGCGSCNGKCKTATTTTLSFVLRLTPIQFHFVSIFVLGDIACEETIGEIGENSCIGDEAWFVFLYILLARSSHTFTHSLSFFTSYCFNSPRTTDVFIGHNSCNCDKCKFLVLTAHISLIFCT